MQLPLFYLEEYSAGELFIKLNEDSSRHIVQVLRMKKGMEVRLTDGKGNLLTAEIEDDHKKHCLVKIKDSRFIVPPSAKIIVAISLLKNANRFEWFLEKATEIGVNEIIPLICERTEKQKFRYERMKGICISAMIQSQQCWLPVLPEPLKFENAVKQIAADGCQKFIAHCVEGDKKSLYELRSAPLAESMILVGPEGDFTKQEIEFAIENGCIPVTLGDTRLRSETAGVAAAVLLNQNRKS